MQKYVLSSYKQEHVFPAPSVATGRKAGRVRGKTFLLMFFLFSFLFVRNASATAPITGDSLVCSGSTTTYASHVGPGNWTVTVIPSSAGIVLYPYGPVTQVQWTNTGTSPISAVITLQVGALYYYDSITICPVPQPVITTQNTNNCNQVKEQPNGFSTTSAITGHGNPKFDTCFTVCDSSWAIYNVGYVPGDSFLWNVNGEITWNVIAGTHGTSILVHWGAPGAGLITVTETNACGCVGSATRCITIIATPSAVITTVPPSTGGVLHICLNDSVTFDASHSTGDISFPINGWNWVFTLLPGGPTTTATGVNVVHGFHAPGTYLVNLIVTNACGCADTAVDTVIVDPFPGPTIYCISTVCAFDTATYYCQLPVACPGAIYYWTATNGVIMGSNSLSHVTVQWGNGSSGYGVICVTVTNCGTICSYQSCSEVPIVPSTTSISGPSVVCAPGGIFTYSVEDVPSTVYHWQVLGSGWIVPPYDSSHTVQVQVWGPAGSTVTIHVDYKNTFLGCGGTGDLTVYIKPSYTVSGPRAVCHDDISVYNSTSLSGTTSWQVLTDLSSMTSCIALPAGTSASINWASVITSCGGSMTYPMTFYVVASNPSYCNSPQYIAVTVYNNPPPVSLAAGDLTVCPNYTYTYWATPTPGNYVHWAVTGGTPASADGSSLGITWNSTGPYSIVLTQLGIVAPNCPSPPTTVTINPFVLVPGSVAPTPVTTCVNSFTTFTVSGSNANYYSWYLSNPLLGSIQSGQGTNTVVIQWNNAPGTTLVYVNEKICDSTTQNVLSASVTVISVPPVSFSANVVCSDMSSSPTIFTSTTLGSSYQWNFGDGNSTTTSTNTVSHVYASGGTYIATLTVNNINNCFVSGTGTYTVTVHQSPIVTISSAGSCIPQTMTAYVTGSTATPFSYQWYFNSAMIGGATTNTYTGTAIGTYCCTVSDANGCVGSGCKVLVDSCCHPIAATGAFTWTHYCGTSTFTETSVDPGACTGYPIEWAFGDGLSGSGTVVTHTYAAAGIYTVSMIIYMPDSNGHCCPVVAVTHEDTIPLVQHYTTSLTCTNNGPYNAVINNLSTHLGGLTTSVISVTPSIAYTISSNNIYVTGTPAGGNYTFTIMESTTFNSVVYTCTTTYLLTIPPQPVVNITMSYLGNPLPFYGGLYHICEHLPITFNSGYTGSAVSYVWSFGDLTGSNLGPTTTRAYVPNLLPPHYWPVTCTITDLNGCTYTGSIIVKVEPNGFDLHISSPAAKCEGDTVTLSANGNHSPGSTDPYTFTWYGGSGTVIHGPFTTDYDTLITSLDGNYYTVVTDKNLCADTSEIGHVKHTHVPSPNVMGATDYCDNDLINLTMNQGSGYIYNWYIQVNTTTYGPYTGTNFALFYGNHYSTYIVTAQIIASGCTTSVAIPITFHGPPDAFITASGNCLASGPILLTASSDSASVIYNWSTGAYGSNLTVTQGGNYTVTVTNQWGCQAQTSHLVDAPADFSELIVGCYDFCDTSAITHTIMIPDYHPGYGYTWFFNGVPMVPQPMGTPPNLVPTMTGAYSLEVEVPAGSGCIYHSQPVNVNIQQCEVPCCDGNIIYADSVVCDSAYSSSNPSYHIRVYLNYGQTTPGQVIGYTSSTGTITSPPLPFTIVHGANYFWMDYTAGSAMDNSFCVELIIKNMNNVMDTICHTLACGPLPKCNSSQPCDMDIKITAKCAYDANMNLIPHQYNLSIDVNNNGPNCAITFFTAQGSLYPLVSFILLNGPNHYNMTFYDAAPFHNYICLNALVQCGGHDCQTTACVSLPECGTECDLDAGVYTITCLGPDSLGHMRYHFKGAFTSLCSPGYIYITSPDGLIAGQVPAYGTPLGFASYLIQWDFTNYTGNPNPCFYFNYVCGGGGGHQGQTCYEQFCIKLPDCGGVPINSTYILRVSPNPSINSSTLFDYFISPETMSNSGAEFVILDELGRIVMRRNIQIQSHGTILLENGALAQGVYLSAIILNGEMIVSKHFEIIR